MIVPLFARGRTFGALTFVAAESGRRYGPDDLAQAEDVARRAALAIDNALLHHTAQEARRDAELAASVSGRLHAITASLARAATLGEVGRVAVDEGAAALDADAGAVFLASDHGERFTTLAHTGYPPELDAAHSSFVADADNPVTEAARTRHPVVVASGEELVSRWPALAGDQGATGDQATIAQPILVGKDLIGVLHVAFRAPRAFAEWELAFVETLASQTGQALVRSQLYERDHAAAVALQQTLLPNELPAAVGVSLGAHYVPARPEANVGGDWYDAMLLDDRTIAVSVGDVVGHGLSAATAMGQLRNAVRAYLLEDISPGQVLRRLPSVRDLLVAIGEAATNAIEHPRDSTKAVFRVEGRLGHGELVVRVSDSGRWREPSLPTDRGRGLAFMRKLVSDVEVVESDGGTAVVLRQDLRDRSRERNR